MKTQLIVHPHELDKTIIDGIANGGADVIGIHPVGGRHALSALEEMLAWLETDEAKSLIDYAKKLGLDIEYEVHAGSFLAPRELFAAHPEYFRMEKGVRTSKNNFCPSSDEMLAIVAENAKKLAKKLYGSSDNYNFWLDDVTANGGCECDKCAFFSPSDQQMKVTNIVARALKEINPNAKVAYLSYRETLTPPKNIKPDDNVFLEYAPIERDRSVFVGDDGKIAADLRALWEVFPRESTKILEYWYDNSLFSDWKKPPKKFIPDNAAIEREMRFYKSLGAPYISSFACYLGEDYRARCGMPDFSALKNFVKNERA